MSASNREAAVVSLLGTLGDGVVGSGDRDGRLTLSAAGIELECWVGADDAWRMPSDGGARTVRAGTAPAIDTRVRVPGGEVVLNGYAVAGAKGPRVVADFENASGGAMVVAWVVRAAPGYRIGRVAMNGSTLVIDERARVDLPRAPLRWAVAPRAEGVRDAVLGGDAAGGPFEPVVTRRGDLEIALLFPVAHHTRTRVAASVLDAGDPSEWEAVVVAQLPALADVERGWVAALEVGTRVELPDDALQGATDAARATLALAVARGRPRDRIVADSAAAWGLLPASARAGRASRARAATDPWPSLRATPADAGASARGAAEWLGVLRDALLSVERDRVDLLPWFPVEWLGLPVAVHDAPTTRGPVSFALRWHGARPALLWEAPPDVAVRASGLDAAWNAVASSGEALLGEISSTRLLPLTTPVPSDVGVVVDEPESFT